MTHIWPTTMSLQLFTSFRHYRLVQMFIVSFWLASNTKTLSPANLWLKWIAHEDGRSQLLLNLVGTLPVTFRGATYQIPLKIWLLHEYPKQPPMVFVNPTRDMLIRPGNHVDPSGRCYHPYLANWVNYSDVCLETNLISDHYQYQCWLG